MSLPYLASCNLTKLQLSISEKMQASIQSTSLLKPSTPTPFCHINNMNMKGWLQDRCGSSVHSQESESTLHVTMLPKRQDSLGFFWWSGLLTSLPCQSVMCKSPTIHCWKGHSIFLVWWCYRCCVPFLPRKNKRKKRDFNRAFWTEKRNVLVLVLLCVTEHNPSFMGKLVSAKGLRSSIANITANKQ